MRCAPSSGQATRPKDRHASVQHYTKDWMRCYWTDWYTCYKLQLKNVTLLNRDTLQPMEERKYSAVKQRQPSSGTNMVTTLRLTF